MNLNVGVLSRLRQLLDNIGKIRNIPCVMVQGRYDVVRALNHTAKSAAATGHPGTKLPEAVVAGVTDFCSRALTRELCGASRS